MRFATEQRMVKEWRGRTLYTLCVSDRDDEEVRIAARPVESDWPVWLLLRVRDLRGWMPESEIDGRNYWSVTVEAVSPHAAGVEKIRRALACMGIEGVEDLEWLTRFSQRQRDRMLAEILADYGVHAVIWQGQGSNRADLVKAAREEMTMATSLFGFYMDRQQNAVGADGWQAIRGILWPWGEEDPEEIDPQADLYEVLAAAA